MDVMAATQFLALSTPTAVSWLAYIIIGGIAGAAALMLLLTSAPALAVDQEQDQGDIDAEEEVGAVPGGDGRAGEPHDPEDEGRQRRRPGDEVPLLPLGEVRVAERELEARLLAHDVAGLRRVGRPDVR